MKGVLFSLILLFSFTAGCKKKTYTCSRSIYYDRQCSVAFSGFSEQELEKVVLYRYEANTNFNELIGIDTFYVVNPYITGDTVYAANHTVNGFIGFWNISKGVDYQIHIVNPNKTYSITGIATGPSSVSWEQDTRCGMGASQASIQTVNNIHINNRLVYPFNPPDDDYNFFIYVQH